MGVVILLALALHLRTLSFYGRAPNVHRLDETIRRDLPIGTPRPVVTVVLWVVSRVDRCLRL